MNRFYYELDYQRGQPTGRATVHDRTGRFGYHGTLMCSAVSIETALKITEALNADPKLNPERVGNAGQRQKTLDARRNSKAPKSVA